MTYKGKISYIHPMESIQSSKYKIGSPIDLGTIPTLANFNKTGKELKKTLEDVREELGKFQNTLYAHGKYAVLICLQGMDTSGKDSLIREVFKDCNASGVEVHSFKVPTQLERDHDYLWRHYLALPAKGKFRVFNRTHYENVLVTRVHPEYILGENIPGVETLSDVNESFWDARFEQINNFEKHLAENGTLIFKFYLHLSKEEQRQRLLRRLRLEQKHWKFSPGDLKERALWEKYTSCYQEAINRSSEPHAPWFVVPADNKRAARVIVASILLEELRQYKDIREPEMDEEIRANIELYRTQLEKEAK